MDGESAAERGGGEDERGNGGAGKGVGRNEKIEVEQAVFFLFESGTFLFSRDEEERRARLNFVQMEEEIKSRDRQGTAKLKAVSQENKKVRGVGKIFGFVLVFILAFVVFEQFATTARDEFDSEGSARDQGSSA